MIKLAAMATSEEWSQSILVQNWFEERSHLRGGSPLLPSVCTPAQAPQLVNRAVVRQASVGIPDLALDTLCKRGQKTGRSEAEQAGYLDEKSAVQQSWKSRL